MIYIFGEKEKISVVYDGSTLTPEQKAQATTIVSFIPEPEEIENNYSILYLDPTNLKLSYIYKPYTTIDKLQKLVNEGKITQEEMNELL